MIIYKVTNLCNGKIYIGQSKTNDPNYFGSGKLICKAIRKYSKINFLKEILEEVKSEEELDAREVYWISYFKEVGHTLYNIQDGGRGWSQKVLKEYWKNRQNSEKENIKKLMKGLSPEKIHIITNIEKSKKEKMPLSVIAISLSSKNSSRPVYQFSMTGDLLNTFQSLEHAYFSLNNAKSRGNLSSACNGKRNSCGGYRWSYTTSCHHIEYKKVGRPLGKKDTSSRKKNHTNSIRYTILQYDECRLIHEWESINQIKNVLNLSKQMIFRAIKNKTKYKGFTWKKGTSYIKTTFVDSDITIIKKKTNKEWT
jgi:hypothetical protein